MTNQTHTQLPNAVCPHEITTAAFQTYLKYTPDMMFVKDINLVYVAASLPFAHMVGKNSVEEIIGHTDFEIFESQELARRYTSDDDKLLRANTDSINYIEPLTDNNGHPRYSTTSKFILRNEQNKPIGILGISRDITREYMSRQRYQQEMKYLFELPDDTFAALFLDIDDWRIIRHHRHTVQNHNVRVCDNMNDFTENALNCIVDTGNPETIEFFRNLSKESLLEICNSGTRHFSLEYLRRMPNGEEVWVHVDINFLIDPENSHLCAIWSLKNINDMKQEEINLQYAAEYDEMTGLLNRTFTTKNIQQILTENEDSMHALLTIDVDNFKSLNDTKGHQTGDVFLMKLGQIFQKCFRESDVVGRVGGDEFFILMKNIVSKEVVKNRAESLLNLTHNLCLEYPDLNLSISIGISIYPEDGQTLEDLYASADHALYQGKKHGKNQFVFAEK